MRSLNDNDNDLRPHLMKGFNIEWRVSLFWGIDLSYHVSAPNVVAEVHVLNQGTPNACYRLTVKKDYPWNLTLLTRFHDFASDAILPSSGRTNVGELLDMDWRSSLF